MTLFAGHASTKPLEREATATRLLPPYHVILMNDDHHSMEFVVNVLRKALGYSDQHAAMLTLEAHEQGRAIVWTGSKEVAELKMEQIQSFHEVRMAGQKLGPLSVYIEPAPG